MEQFELEKLSQPYNLMEPEIIQIQKVTPDQDNLSALIHEVELLREQIECWRNIDAQKNYELQAFEQELWETNQELIKAVEFQHKSFTQVKELAKTLVATEKSASECLAELISTIYSLPVKSEELVSNEKLNNPTQPEITPDTSRVIAEARELRKTLKVRLEDLKTKFAVLSNTYNKISIETALITATKTEQSRQMYSNALADPQFPEKK